MVQTAIKRKNIVPLLLMTVLALAIYGQQSGITVDREESERLTLNYLPSGKFLKGMALGYDEALADLLWVRTVAYFGEHLKTDREYTWLVHMLRLIIALDPRYESPYEFAAVILPTELNDPDTAIELLHKGVENVPRHHPRYWLQPFYLGFCYLVYKDDPQQAAHYFEMAARFPQRPPYLPLLVARLHASRSRPEIGFATLQSLLDDSKNEALQDDRARTALIERQKELLVALHLRLLQNATDEYRALTGRSPQQLAELVEALLLPFLPAEPFGGYYFLDWEDRVRSSHTQGEFKVHGNKKQRMAVLQVQQEAQQ